MSEQYIKAEIVTPKVSAGKWVGQVLSGLLMNAFRTLIVWWFIAAWFPELGLTFWQLVLPVYAARMIFGNPPRPLPGVVTYGSGHSTKETYMSDKERDELAREIFLADNHNIRTVAAQEWAQNERADRPEYVYGIADGLITAGYRKPGPIDSSEVSIMNGWLVQSANECTCGAGPNLGMGHERGCGYEPLMNIGEPLERAGYTLNTKPRTIAEHYGDEGLESLSYGTVIMSGVTTSTAQTDGTWLDSYGSTYDFWELALPATVLHDPTIAGIGHASGYCSEACNELSDELVTAPLCAYHRDHPKGD